MTDYNTLTGLPLASQAFTDAILGPIIAGWTVNLIMFGFVASQFIQYLHSDLFKRDSPRLKALLITVFSLTAINSGLVFYSVYHYATWQQRDEDTLFGQTEVDCFATLPVGIIGALVQVFLSLRASALFKSQWARAIYFFFVAVGVTGGLVGSWLYLALSFLLRANKLEMALPMTFSIATGMWLWCCAFVDVLITVSLCVLLRKRLSSFNESRSILRRLIMLAIECALYTSVCALLGAVLSYSFSGDSLHANSSGAFFLPLSSFYCLSLITTLAARAKTREMARETAGGKTTNQGTHNHINTDGYNTPPSMSPRIELSLSRERSYDYTKEAEV